MSSISFFKNLKFLSHRSFIYWVTDNLRYFISLEAFVKAVVFLISFSGYLLFEDFFEGGVNFVSSCLLQVCIPCRCFPVDLESSVYTVRFYKDQYFDFFPICILLFSFSCFALRLQVLYWIDMERVDNLVFFLIIVELLWVSLLLSWYWIWARCKMPLLCLGAFLVFQISPVPLSWRVLEFVKDHLCI